MTKVKNNDYISVDYTGTFKDGEVFDSSKGRDPLTFKAGAGMVIKGFDSGVLGMIVGEEKEIQIKAENAYGPVNTQEQVLSKKMFPDKDILEIGKESQVMTNMGPMIIKINKIEGEKVKATLNHPLAGKDLVFKVKLVKILTDKEVKEMETHSCGCGSCSNEEDGCNCQ